MFQGVDWLGWGGEGEVALLVHYSVPMIFNATWHPGPFLMHHFVVATPCRFFKPIQKNPATLSKFSIFCVKNFLEPLPPQQWMYNMD